MGPEPKDSEGDPHLKQARRMRAQEIAHSQMMSDVPTADVIIVNPTHYAVALVYRDDRMSAPKVVAKGADQVAARIREVGHANSVPMLEAPPLARALYRHADLDSEIPAELYTAVAEVLAWVFELRNFKTGQGDRPVRPSSIDVPSALDTGVTS